MEINISTEYAALIGQLKAHKRPRLDYTRDQVKELVKLLPEQDQTEKDQSICLMAHVQSHSELISKELQTHLVLGENLQPSTIINIYWALQKHCIQFNARKGDRVPESLITILKQNLRHKDPEVYEWTLRLIDEVGNPARGLLPEIMKTKPGFLGSFNPHNRNSIEIIAMLLKRWGKA